MYLMGSSSSVGRLIDKRDVQESTGRVLVRASGGEHDGIPPVVLTTAILAIATLPLASALRPPRALAERDIRLCVIFGAAGFLGLVAAMGLALADLFWPGVAAFALGLTALHLMFWCAGEPRKRHHEDEEDDEGGGGGGGRPPQEPPRPIDPGGVGLDWTAFDRERARWEAERRERLGV
jgi:hypothetical protein